jgi:TIR domain
VQVKAPAHVFISYVDTDSSVALGITKELRKLGHETWTYEENGLPGHSYLEQVHAAIQRCDAFVLLASTDSLKSHQVRREAETAYEQQKFVIPIRLKVSHDQLQALPIFRMVSGTAVSLPTDGTNLTTVAERIAASLGKPGFQNVDEDSSSTKGDKSISTPRERRATRYTKTAIAALVMTFVGAIIELVGIRSDVGFLVFLGAFWVIWGVIGFLIEQRRSKQERK